jgi:UDP-glucose 4-epimerase
MDLAEAHVSALRFAMQQPDSSYYNTFNLGSGQGNSVLELVRQFEKVSGKPLPYRVGPRRAGDVMAVWADVKKSNAQLGWSTQRSLAQALEDAWRWQQKITDVKT